MKVIAPTAEGLEEAAEALWNGEVVAYPTETVYGLAVDPFSEKAVRKLFEVKGREADRPVLLIVDDEEDLFDAVEAVGAPEAALIEAFWPGPLSILFKKSADLPPAVTAGSERVCVRCPACDIARDLCSVYGGPLTSSSANASGEEAARSVAQIKLPGVALAIDGGTLEPSAPSTVYDAEEGRVLRPGRISEEAIRRAISEGINGDS